MPMGRRQIRLRAEQLTPDALLAHVGQMLDVIGHDGITRHGLLRQVNADGLEIEDSNRSWYNRRKHRHHLPLSNVREVVVAVWQGY